MKIHYLFILFLSATFQGSAKTIDTKPIQDSVMLQFFKQTRLELKIVQVKKYNQISLLNHQLKTVNKKIDRIAKKKKIQTQSLVQAMLEKDRLRESGLRRRGFPCQSDGLLHAHRPDREDIQSFFVTDHSWILQSFDEMSPDLETGRRHESQPESRKVRRQHRDENQPPP